MGQQQPSDGNELQNIMVFHQNIVSLSLAASSTRFARPNTKGGGIPCVTIPKDSNVPVHVFQCHRQRFCYKLELYCWE